MILYHGTTTKFLDSILKKGLTPVGYRKHLKKVNIGSGKKIKKKIIDNSFIYNIVYLSTISAPHFAWLANSEGYNPVVFEVDIPLNSLYPSDFFLVDEFFKEIKRKDIKLNWKSGSLTNKLNEFLDDLDEYKEFAIDSIVMSGACIHVGAIKPNRFVRYVILDEYKMRREDPTQDYMTGFDLFAHTLFSRTELRTIKRFSSKEIWKPPLAKEVVYL